MEKYTATQWAEIEGGHEMTPTTKPQYSFIGELNESALFRTKKRVEGTNAREMADLAFMNFLLLYILYNENDFAVAAKDYAGRTMKYGGNFNYMQSGTDLHIALASLKNNMNDAGDKNQIQNSRIVLPEMQIKNFLNQMKQGRPVTAPPAFFLKLEKGLNIQNSNYRSIRRLVGDWPRLSSMQKQLAITRMLQFFRVHALRSELYSYLRDLSRSQGLEVKNAHNAETPKMRGSDTMAKLATAAAAATAGYYLGKSLARGSLTKGITGKFSKDSRPF